MNEALGLVTLFVTVLALTIAAGKPLIAYLQRLSLRQHAYEDAPKTHAGKTGTPTMGGLLFVIALAAACAWHPDRTTFALAFAGLGCGAIGAADDLVSIRKGRNRGLRAREKFLLTIAVAVAFLAVADGAIEPQVRDVVFAAGGAVLHVPHWLWYVLGLLAMVATTNAVNLTDGLDGLAIGCVLVSSTALTVLTYLSSNARFADYLDIAKIPDAGELVIFCGSLVGASLGFLWYNAHPAEMFMGDVGSLALGGALGTVAVIIKQEILLLSIGGVFVLEALSVIIQVGSFKLTGKRVFRMAPLHHHFELMGWSESKIIVRFWIIALVFALFSLTTLKLR